MKNQKEVIASRFFGDQSQNQKVPSVEVGTNGLTTIDVITPWSDSILASELVDSISYVPLETTENCLIGDIDKLFFANERIIIVDKSKAVSIFVFEKNGKFHSKVSALGKGPGEYLGINDVAIDYRTGNILLLDLSNRKILTYNQDGTFLSELPIGFYVYELALLPGKPDFVLANHSEFNAHYNQIYLYNIIQTDSLIKPYAKSFPFSEQSGLQFHWYNRFNFRTDGSSLYYYARFSDTIFRIEDDKIMAEFKIDHGKYKFPVDFIEKPTDERFVQLRSSGNFSYFMGDFVKSDKNLICKVNTKGSDQYVFHSLKTGLTKVAPTIALDRSDILLFNIPMHNSNDLFVSAITVQAAAMEIFASAHYLETKDKRLIEKFTKLKETDNPIVLFYTLKSF